MATITLGASSVDISQSGDDVDISSGNVFVEFMAGSEPFRIDINSYNSQLKISNVDVDANSILIVGPINPNRHARTGNLFSYSNTSSSESGQKIKAWQG